MTSSVLYFSPAHTCKKAAESVYDALSAYGACTLYSATLPEEREILLKAGIHTTLLVVICPVYAQRPPTLFSRFLSRLPLSCQGAAAVCLYGGISAGASLNRMYRLFNRRHIPIYGAASVPSLHSYRNEPHAKLPQKSAPFSLPADFWVRVRGNLEMKTEISPPKPRLTLGCLFPQRLAAKLGVRYPKKEKECAACGICQKSCPAGVLWEEKALRNSCIRCGACTLFCPHGARKLRFTCPLPAIYLSLHAKKPKKPAIFL